MHSKRAFYLLCFTIWFAPIPIGANRPWAWGGIEFLICINTLLACYCYSFGQVIMRLQQVKVILTIITIVQVWVMMQWLGGIYPSISILKSIDPSLTKVALIKGISFCLFIINLTLLVDRIDRVKQLCWVIMIAGLTQSLYAIFLQYSGWDKSLLGFNIGRQAAGSFVYHNHLANYLLLCLSVAIGYLISSLEGMKCISKRQKLVVMIETMLSVKWAARISIIIMMVALIMTHSLMGNFAFFISMLLTSVSALILMKRPPCILKWVVLILFVLDLIIVKTYFNVEKVEKRLEGTSFQTETRDNMVRDVIPYIRDYGLIGSGAGTFYSTFFKYQSIQYQVYYEHAHNEYVEFLAEFGLLPSLFLLAMVLYVICTTLRTLRFSHHRFKHGLAITGLMACICMLMHCTVDFVLQDYAIALLFITILTLPFILNNLVEQKKAHKRI